MMEVKARILQKAHDLFHRYGIRSVSMDEIATQMGMSKKTLYQHFADKEQLVDEVFATLLTQKKEECTVWQQQGANALHEVFLSLDRFHEMLSNMHPSLLFDLEKYHPEVFRKFRHFQSDFVYKLIRKNLERGIEEGLYRPEIDVDVLARFRVATMTIACSQEAFPNMRLNIAYIEHQLVEVFLFGVATPKGQKLIHKYNEQRQKIQR
jgi:AcrR family transcriptional regulator